MRGEQAGIDELVRDKDGLGDGRGLKKVERVGKRDGDTFKWALIVL